jgi:hypothetical protein
VLSPKKLTRAVFTVVLMGFGALSASFEAQSKPTTVQIDLRVGGAAYTISGPGECHATDDASIYNAPAGMKGVQQSDASRSLSFTMWRLVKGGDMITLDITLGAKRHRVNTLTVAPAAERRGSGSVTFQARGAGGVFTFDATADTGARITGQVSCSAFAKPEENG